MATKTKSKSGSRGKAAARSSTPRRSPRSPSPSRQAVGSVLSAHHADLWGVGAVLLGLLAAASVWLGAAGIIGSTLDDGLALAFGLLRIAVPVGLVALGVALIRGDDLDQADAERLARAAVGGVLILVSLSGLLHVLRGRPGLDDPVATIGAAGGVVGMAFGGVLHGLTALAGSLLVLGAVGVVGVMVLTGASARQVARGAAGVMRPAWRASIGALRGLFRDPGAGEVIDLRDSRPFDQDDAREPEPEPDPEPRPAPASRRSRAATPAQPIKEQGSRRSGSTRASGPCPRCRCSVARPSRRSMRSKWRSGGGCYRPPSISSGSRPPSSTRWSAPPSPATS
ncbi:MAG: DNA translocase FtsK 4TM domain-containing protein [Acidimicrobiales bacterium]